MRSPVHPPLLAAIACGGTGGHLFPGLAVAEELMRRDCAVLLILSEKEVDRQAVTGWSPLASGSPLCQVMTLPAIGLARGRWLAFAAGLAKSYRAARRRFRDHPPRAALSMGGFIGAGPMIAARLAGARIFLHEANSIPGRANRWLSCFAHRGFTGFEQAARGLHVKSLKQTGMPVRARFEPKPAEDCRARLGLDRSRPVLLVMGGSQGASGVNRLALQAAPGLRERFPDLQFLHLAGTAEAEAVKKTYAVERAPAVVYPFLEQMEIALGAATVAVSRAGASSLAELAAMRVPAVLVPYPAAADNHQFYNAKTLADSGAAVLLEQRVATGEVLAAAVGRLLADSSIRDGLIRALPRWHSPKAAEEMAVTILNDVSSAAGLRAAPPAGSRSAIQMA